MTRPPVQQNSPGKRGRKWGCLLFFVGICLLPVVLVTLGWLTVLKIGEAKLARAKEAFAAHGLPMTLEECFPQTVPEDENFFATPAWESLIAARDGRNAGEEIDVFEESAFRWVDDVRDNLQLPSFAGERAPLTHRETGEFDQAWVETLDATLLEEISRASRERPLAFYPVEREKMMGASYEHLRQLDALARVYSMRACLAAERGDGEMAFKELRTVFRLAEIAYEEPSLAGTLVGITVEAVLNNAIWFCLERGALQQGHLRELRDRYPAARERIDTVLKSLNTDRLALEATLLTAARNGEYLAILELHESKPVEPEDRLAKQAFGFFYLNVWWPHDMAEFHCLWNEVFTVMQSSTPQDVLLISENLKMRERVKYPMTYITVPVYFIVLERVFQCEEVAQLTQLAMDLEHYRLENGELPGSLAAVDRPKPSSNPLLAHPIHYKLTNDGQDFQLKLRSISEAKGGGRIDGEWRWSSQLPEEP